MAKTINQLYTDNPITTVTADLRFEVAKTGPNESGATRAQDIADFMRGYPFPSRTVSTAGSAAVAGKLIFVTDESGGPVMAFSDGTNWRRLTDRAIIT